MNENINADREQIKANLKEARDAFYGSIKGVFSSLKNYAKISVSSKKLFFSDFNNKRLLRELNKKEAKMQKIANRLGIELLVQYDNKLNFGSKQEVNSSNAEVTVSDNLENVKSEKREKKKHFSWFKRNNKDSKLENDFEVQEVSASDEIETNPVETINNVSDNDGEMVSDVTEDNLAEITNDISGSEEEVTDSDEVKDNLEIVLDEDSEEEILDDNKENNKSKHSFFSKIKNIFRRKSISSESLENDLDNETDVVDNSLENEDEPTVESIEDSTKSDSSVVIPVETKSESKDENASLPKVNNNEPKVNNNEPTVVGKYYNYAFEEIEGDNKKLELNNSTVPEVTSKSKMKNGISNRLLNSNFGLNLRIAFQKVGIALLTATNFTTEKIADFCDRRREKDLNDLRELREMAINSKGSISSSNGMVRRKSLQ